MHIFHQNKVNSLPLSKRNDCNFRILARENLRTTGLTYCYRYFLFFSTVTGTGKILKKGAVEHKIMDLLFFAGTASWNSENKGASTWTKRVKNCGSPAVAGNGLLLHVLSRYHINANKYLRSKYMTGTEINNWKINNNLL